MKSKVLIVFYILLLACIYTFLLNQKDSGPRAFYGIYAVITTAHDLGRIASLEEEQIDKSFHLWPLRVLKSSFGFYVIKGVIMEIKTNLRPSKRVSFDLEKELKELEASWERWAEHKLQQFIKRKTRHYYEKFK